MGITLVWEDDEKTILRHIYDGQWTTADLYRAIDESRRLLLEVKHPVDLIIDMRTSADPPSGVLPAYQHADRQKPDNQRLVVMVQTGKVMQTINRVTGKVAPKTAQNRVLVDTMEEAFALIAKYRAEVAADK